MENDISPISIIFFAGFVICMVIACIMLVTGLQ